MSHALSLFTATVISYRGPRLKPVGDVEKKKWQLSKLREALTKPAAETRVSYLGDEGTLFISFQQLDLLMHPQILTVAPLMHRRRKQNQICPNGSRISYYR